MRVETTHVPLAQLDRAFGYGPKGRGFESLKARQQKTNIFGCSSFVYVINALRDSKGAAAACGGEKPSSEWFFSTPGWRRHCPSDAGSP